MRTHRVLVELSVAAIFLALMLGSGATVQAATHSVLGHRFEEAGGNAPNPPSPPGGSVPEAPYAMVFPIAIAGVVWLTYCKQSRRSAL